MDLTRLAKSAWASLIVVLTLWPALMVVIGGRYLDALDYGASYDPDSFYSWMGRLGTLLALALASVTIAFGPQKSRHGQSTHNRAFPLLIALTLFLIGHGLAPSLFGAVPHLETGTLHAFLILYAAYAARRMPINRFLTALKGSLLALMLGSLLTIVVAPTLSVQTVASEVLRLPILEYRYWGLGSNPNNIAPLALLLLLLTIHTPFKARGLTFCAYLSAIVTIILAQSVTTWTAGMLVVPIFALYCLTPKPIRKARVSPLLAVVAIAGATVGLSMLIWEIAHFDFSNLSDMSVRIESGSFISREKYDDSGMFSGRTDIWEIAMGVWRDHPWFGYGITAWDTDFRFMIGLPNAFHAHNQVMQTVSVGGWVALVVLLVYLMTLLTLSWRTNRSSNGLTIALMIVLLIRGFSESPLETATLLSGEVLFHVALVHLVAHYSNVRRLARKSRSRSRRRRRGHSTEATVGLRPSFEFRQLPSGSRHEVQ